MLLWCKYDFCWVVIVGIMTKTGVFVSDLHFLGVFSCTKNRFFCVEYSIRITVRVSGSEVWCVNAG